MSLPQQDQQYQARHSSRDFVLPLNALHRDMLALVGGKAANLGAGGHSAGYTLPHPLIFGKAS
jgi:hypothetical protein